MNVLPCVSMSPQEKVALTPLCVFHILCVCILDFLKSSMRKEKKKQHESKSAVISKVVTNNPKEVVS